MLLDEGGQIGEAAPPVALEGPEPLAELGERGSRELVVPLTSAHLLADELGPPQHLEVLGDGRPAQVVEGRGQRAGVTETDRLALLVSNLYGASP